MVQSQLHSMKITCIAKVVIIHLTYWLVGDCIQTLVGESLTMRMLIEEDKGHAAQPCDRYSQKLSIAIS